MSKKVPAPHPNDTKVKKYHRKKAQAPDFSAIAKACTYVERKSFIFSFLTYEKGLQFNPTSHFNIKLLCLFHNINNMLPCFHF